MSFIARRVRLVLFLFLFFLWMVLGYEFWLCFIIYDKILMKRLVSFRKFNISSGLEFLKWSFKLFVW